MNIKDPFVLFFIVRESLNLEKGRIAAQTAHAIQNLLLIYFRTQLLEVKAAEFLTPQDYTHLRNTAEWLSSASKKNVLKANEDDWALLKEEFKDSIIIKDSSLNEDAVICLWPQIESKCSLTIRKLPILDG